MDPWDWLQLTLGTDRPVEELTMANIVARCVVVFLLGLVIFRVGKSRFMGRHTLLDVFLVLVLATVLSRAINTPAPFWPTMVGGVALVALHGLLTYAAYHSHLVGNLVKGRSHPLIEDGKPVEREMRRHHLSRNDLEEALRLRDLRPDEIQEAWLERNGQISFLRKRRGDGGLPPPPGEGP